ncbi:hypothetical protein CLHOM_00190 [Clostridium homopropionicum DSM 5847]|uniref:Uncharacterized protein n=1 Tax=Clostridium homopropionicum DSM 5847 TaxID=1121318 RepID=A0A0L6ZF09_9CLOT|nr:hypothetical protein [Clostridium homopropionicum]KOA21560.1 hypothetical protein CLHOM_00190 [Clostridium homopropionicum DSM 5847]SFG99994.1 hypothetical protein SAMN04488501_1334 [Clostridium homopropionicum]
MKRKAFLLIVFTLILSLFVACEGHTLKPDTPENTTLLLDLRIGGNEYEKFNELFSEQRKNVVSKDMLKEFSNLSTKASMHTLYEVIEYSNGEMLLVRLNQKQGKGDYKVEDVVRIPEDMKKLFITE